MTLICFLKILKITLLFPFYQFPIQRPHIWSKAVIASLNWRMEALNQSGCSSRCHLATLPVREAQRCLAEQFLHPVSGTRSRIPCCGEPGSEYVLSTT